MAALYDHDHENEIIVLGQTNFRNSNKAFGIKTDDRRRHLYAIGKTGMGKTNFLEFMTIQDIRNGHGLCVVDPHGDYAEMMLDYIPDHRIKDVVYVDPSDLDFPIAFNVLEKVDERYKHLVASGLVGVFKKIFADSWGPRLEYILRNSILSLLDTEDATMLGITRLLVDKKYRRDVVRQITDPVVKSFWIDEFENYNDKMRTEAVSPIQNKVGQFLSSSIIRNIVGQPKSTINIEDIMNEGKILILNLAKGKIGEDISALLGAMIITKIQLAAMARQSIPESERRDFYLYVDEFQNFATGAFATILSEARKYRLNLIVAHQYVAQMEETVRDAIFGNVGTLSIFRIGADDAHAFERELAPEYTETDLVNLTKYNNAMKLMIDGVASSAFSASTLPITWEKTGNRDEAIAYSREHYARSRSEVEQQIIEWTGIDVEKPTLPPMTPPAPMAPVAPAAAMPPALPKTPAPIPTEPDATDDEEVLHLPSRFAQPASSNVPKETPMEESTPVAVPAESTPPPAPSLKDALAAAMKAKQEGVSTLSQPDPDLPPPAPAMDRRDFGDRRAPMGGRRERPRRRSDRPDRPEMMDRPMYDAVCAIGGEPVQVPFKPDGMRPVFCQKHLAEARRANSKGQNITTYTPHDPKPVKKEKAKPMPADLPPMPAMPATPTPSGEGAPLPPDTRIEL